VGTVKFSALLAGARGFELLLQNLNVVSQAGELVADNARLDVWRCGSGPPRS